MRESELYMEAEDREATYTILYDGISEAAAGKQGGLRYFGAGVGGRGGVPGHGPRRCFGGERGAAAKEAEGHAFFGRAEDSPLTEP